MKPDRTKRYYGLILLLLWSESKILTFYILYLGYKEVYNYHILFSSYIIRN